MRKQKYKGGFKTKKAAQEYLNKVLAELDEGTYVEPNKESFSTYFENLFNMSYRPRVEETTAETRWKYVEKHIMPFLGDTPLNLITTKKLDDFYYVKLKEGLSPKTVCEFHNLLRSAFTQAVKWLLLKINPALDATPPKLLQMEIQLLTKEQTKDFLKVLETEKVNPIFELIIFSGLRRGEVLGLKLDDIDFLKAKIHVKRSLAKIKEKGLFLKEVKTKSFKCKFRFPLFNKRAAGV